MTTTLNNSEVPAWLTDEDYYTPAEVARLLKFRTARPIYDAMNRKELGHQVFGRIKRISRQDLHAWINRHRQEPAPASPAPAPELGPMSAAAVMEEAA